MSYMRGDLIRICALAVLCVMVSIISRAFSGTVSTAVRISGIILIFVSVMLMISDVISDASAIVEGFSGISQISGYWSVMLKALGIALLCRICTDVCRDCGEGAIAGGVETAGKIAILALSLPMIEEIVVWAQELLSRI